MNQITNYRASSSGRLSNLLVGVPFTLVAVFLLIAFFSEKVKAQNHGWPVYVFVGSIIALVSGYGIYCVIRALELKPRVIVDAEGFSYNGVFSTQRLLWREIKNVRSKQGEWLLVTFKPAGSHTQQVKLDFSGLRPSNSDFIFQANVFAGGMGEKWELIELQAKEAETRRQLEDEQRLIDAPTRRKNRIAAVLIGLPIAAIPSYIALSALMTGQSSVTFHRFMDVITWESDPYVFGFVVIFFGAIGLALLYHTLFLLITGREVRNQRRTEG